MKKYEESIFIGEYEIDEMGVHNKYFQEKRTVEYDYFGCDDYFREEYVEILTSSFAWRIA